MKNPEENQDNHSVFKACWATILWLSGEFDTREEALKWLNNGLQEYLKQKNKSGG